MGKTPSSLNYIIRAIWVQTASNKTMWITTTHPSILHQNRPKSNLRRLYASEYVLQRLSPSFLRTPDETIAKSSRWMVFSLTPRILYGQTALVGEKLDNAVLPFVLGLNLPGGSDGMDNVLWQRLRLGNGRPCLRCVSFIKDIARDRDLRPRLPDRCVGNGLRGNGGIEEVRAEDDRLLARLFVLVLLDSRSEIVELSGKNIEVHLRDETGVPANA